MAIENGTIASTYCPALRELEPCLRDPACRRASKLQLRGDAVAETADSKADARLVGKASMLPQYAWLYKACLEGPYGRSRGWKAPEVHGAQFPTGGGMFEGEGETAEAFSSFSSPFGVDDQQDGDDFADSFQNSEDPWASPRSGDGRR
mmetsp:Transcript_14074/g.52815  ORF Transcript_14074/g.52815 Transcript_14074/m.52815 type:complete len:148 (+) Transcript_14074:446-889(+)